MGYLYETHLHTSVSSACGRSSGRDYVKAYKELGYDGIFVTDHFWLGNTCVPRSLPWTEWVMRYTQSYRETLEAGTKAGLKVFFGWETTYGTGEDFLIYGLSPDWLAGHPEIVRLSQEEQYELVHAEGGLVVQAHPFRERSYMSEIVLHPDHCDAWEIANAGNEPYMDRTAFEYARRRGLKMTCGSDIHDVAWTSQGRLFPVETEIPLRTERDYVRRILSGTGWRMHFPEERMLCKREHPRLKVFDRGVRNNG